MTKKRGSSNGHRKVRKVRGQRPELGIQLREMREEGDSEGGEQDVLSNVRPTPSGKGKRGKVQAPQRLKRKFPKHKPTQILDKMPKMPFVAVSCDWELVDLTVTSIVISKKGSKYVILRNHIRSPLSLEEVSEKELKDGYAYTDAPVEHVLGQYDYMMCVSGIESQAIPVYEKLMEKYKVKTTTKAKVKTAEVKKPSKHVGGKPDGKKAAPAKEVKGKAAAKPVKKEVVEKVDPRDAKTIICIQKENPRRGSKAKNYELFIKNSGKMTVKQYKEKGGSLPGLKTALDKGWIKLK